MNIAVIIGEIAYISRSRIMDGIVDSAKKGGANVILFTCEGYFYHNLKEFSAGEYNIFDLPAPESFDGVIVDLDSIANKNAQKNLHDRILKSGVPCVSFNRKLGNANEIYFENQKGFSEIVEHLIVKHSVKNIHYISGPFSNRDAAERLENFRHTLKKHGLTINEDDIFEGNFN
ncbi:MAG: hypothetical protein ACI4RH_07655, partial [Huintestinicola sp.]